MKTSTALTVLSVVALAAFFWRKQGAYAGYETTIDPATNTQFTTNPDGSVTATNLTTGESKMVWVGPL